MPEFTDNQRAAIEQIGGDVYVSAAAGSGKTAVLVERVVNIISDPVNMITADRLLVVTYTKAAAAEMSERISKRVSQMLKEQPENSWLVHQSKLIKRMSISTIHAFCMGLLREFCIEAGLPIGFFIANDIILDEIRELALAKTAEILYSDEKSMFSGYSDMFGRASSDRDALESVDRFERFLSDIADPSDWKSNCLANLLDSTSIDRSDIGTYILGHAAEMLDEAISEIRHATGLIKQDTELEGAYGEALFYDLHFAESLNKLITANDWDGCCSMLQHYAPLTLKRYAGSNPHLKISVQKLRDGVKKIFRNELKNKIFSAPQAECLEDNFIVIKAAEALFYATEVFSVQLNDIKQRKKMFDYSDLERYTIKLLEEESLVKEEIISRYDYIFIDEYQDINEVQDYLLGLLGTNSKSIFAVGDIKQSIYRFRRADPEIFISKRNNAFPLLSGKYPAHIPLSHNFRSRPEVLDAINDIFSAVMTERTGEVSYAESESLTTLSTRQPEDTGIEIILVDKEHGENAEAEQAAYLISRMLAEGYLVDIPSTDGGIAQRPCREGDFCILLRAKTKSRLFEKALEEADIKVNCDTAQSFFDSSEIEVLISLLSVIDNPRRDVDMAASLLSPLFGFSPDDLLILKQSDHYSDLYTCMLTSGDNRITEFLTRLTSWRTSAATLPADELLSDIIDETGAELLLTTGSEYIRRRDNIRILIEYAANLSGDAGISLSRFLSLMRRKKNQNDPLGGGFTPSDNAVSILTIHRSKGLEWPVVILADTKKGFVYKDFQTPAVIFDKRLGIGIKYKTSTGGPDSPLAIRNTIHFRTIAAYQKQKMISEECRVLYVALTRAKQKIYVTAQINDFEKDIPDTDFQNVPYTYLSANAKDYLTWALLGVCSDRQQLIKSLSEKRTYKSGFISVSCAAPREIKTDAQISEPHQFDHELLKIIKDRIAYGYPRSGLARVPAKLTVSEIVRADTTPISVRTPSFMTGNGMSAAERGNAIHRFMQFADFKSSSESVAGEIKRLADKGYLSEEYAKVIDKDKLGRFFTSELGSRLTNGKVLREYAFIDAMDASEWTGLPDSLGREKIMIQGVADCILFESDGAVLVDYKSDRVDSDEVLIARYHKQLELYKKAVESRFTIPVKECYIYSFHLNRAIKI